MVRYRLLRAGALEEALKVVNDNINDPKSDHLKKKQSRKCPPTYEVTQQTSDNEVPISYSGRLVAASRVFPTTSSGEGAGQSLYHLPTCIRTYCLLQSSHFVIKDK